MTHDTVHRDIGIPMDANGLAGRVELSGQLKIRQNEWTSSKCDARHFRLGCKFMAVVPGSQTTKPLRHSKKHFLIIQGFLKQMLVVRIVLTTTMRSETKIGLQQPLVVLGC